MTHGLDTSFLIAHEVTCHPEHTSVRRRMSQLRIAGDRFGLASQVLTEFVHVVTDLRRFTAPLTVEQALERTLLWWDCVEVERVDAGHDAVKWFHDAMLKHHLGRKRVLYTMMAATYRTAGITSILTLNPADFAVFGEFTSIGSLAANLP